MKKILYILCLILPVIMIGSEVLIDLTPQSINTQISSRWRKIIDYTTQDNGKAVMASTKLASKYCSIKLPLDIKVNKNSVLTFEYKVEVAANQKASYVGLSLTDNNKKSTFASYPLSTSWKKVVLPLGNLISMKKQPFTEDDILKTMNIYVRSVNKLPAGAVKFFLRDCKVVIDKKLETKEFELNPKSIYSQIPRSWRKIMSYTAQDNGKVVMAFTKAPSKYCYVKFPLDIKIDPNSVIMFEYKVEVEANQKASYVGFSIVDNNKKTFYAKYPLSTVWKKVVLPLATLSSTKKQPFTEKDIIKSMNIYIRSVDKLPPKAVKLFIKNCKIVIDKKMLDSNVDRVSYSGVLLFDWSRYPEATHYKVEYSTSRDFVQEKTTTLTAKDNFVLSNKVLTSGIWYYQVTALPQKKKSSLAA